MKSTNFKNCYIFILISILCLSCFLSSCSLGEKQSKTEQDISIAIEKIDEAFEEFKEKYNAIDFYAIEDEFSVDIVDTYKGKNLFTEIDCIDDVFYIEDDMYVYAEQVFEDNYHLLLKITSEQYAKIKTFRKIEDWFECLNSEVGMVFALENIEVEFSKLDAYFSFDNGIADYGLSDFCKTKIVKGTLIDIIEIEI